MSQTDTVSPWTAPREFESSLKSLLAAAHRGGVTFDRAWTFRRTDVEPDLMVEVTRLGDDSGTMAPCGKHAPALDAEAFEMKLSSLLSDAHRSNVPFDRAWTFRCTDCPDLMVEITRLAELE